jgi:uncharacterized protein (UPF0332 family)
MDPEEFLVLAGEWCVGSRQGEWRSSASRAYYSVFHRARNLLRQVGFAVPDSDRAHSYMWRRLQNSGHPDVQEAGRGLQELRRLRNGADYHLDQAFAQDAGIDGVYQSEGIAQLLIEVGGEPAVLARVVAAIRDYERAVGDETWQAP